MSTDTEMEWRWRIQWGGRWVTDPLWRTEAEIRREHPEATRIDATARVRATPVPIGTMYRPATTMDPAITQAWIGRTPGKPPKG